MQGHRFNILEDIGCIPATFNTPPAYPLVFMWPPLIGCFSFVYACKFAPSEYSTDFELIPFTSPDITGVLDASSPIPTSHLILHIDVYQPILPSHDPLLPGNGSDYPGQRVQHLHQHGGSYTESMGILVGHAFQLLTCGAGPGSSVAR